MNITVKMFFFMAFALSFFNLVCTKPLTLETSFQRRQVFNQHSRGEDSQPQDDAFEPEKNISQESDITSDADKFLEIPTTHNRTVRSTHACFSRVVKEYDFCRGSWVDKVQCERKHPACNHVIPKHRVPKCQTEYGYRNSKFANKCPSLPIDCKCAD